MAKGEVKFIDNTMEVINNTENAIEKALLECAAELVSQTAKNTRVDTSQLKNSWKANVDQKGEGFEAVIGSPLENAIWEEFGTGQHALNGNGRKDWAGKKPSRAFWHAYQSLKKVIQDRIQALIKNELKG